jgi:curved DNA-binding protein CbpA
MQLDLFPYAPQRDVYRLLGIDSEADQTEVNAACRRLARTFHPDRNLSRRAHEEMQVVNAVRRLLTDPEARAAYNEERRRWLAGITRPSAPPPARPAGPRPSLSEQIRLRLPAPPPRLSSSLRAVGAGLRAALGGLAPTRCGVCHVVIGGEDRYCLVCGTRLLSGGS